MILNPFCGVATATPSRPCITRPWAVALHLFKRFAKGGGRFYCSEGVKFSPPFPLSYVHIIKAVRAFHSCYIVAVYRFNNFVHYLKSFLYFRAVLPPPVGFVSLCSCPCGDFCKVLHVAETEGFQSLTGASSNHIVHVVVLGDFDTCINETTELAIKVATHSNFNHFSFIFHFLFSFRSSGLFPFCAYIIPYPPRVLQKQRRAITGDYAPFSSVYLVFPLFFVVFQFF